ncbi:MAG: thioredoxin family protein [Planctomycetaceae bacterium]|nr:thioredoxin family protein [Planctomycetaceae bacterium]
MFSLLLTVILTSAPADQQLQQSYAQAYTESLEEKKPLLVVVGAPWCPACRVLKESTLKPMAKTGELDDVSFVVINRDENPVLAAKLTQGEKTIPQIILYTPAEDGWKRRKLRGFQSKQPIRSLIQKALVQTRKLF